MSTFASYDTRMRSRPRGSAFAEDAPLSEHQEMALAAEALEIFGEEELEQFVGNVLQGVAMGAGQVIRPRVARQLGGILKAVAPAGLPAGGALSSLMAPGPGTVVGSKLGWMIDRALELELEGMDREDAELARARRYVGLAATSARHAALAPRDAPPQRVVQSALAEALAKHVPDLLERALAGELSPYDPDFYKDLKDLKDGTLIGAGRPFTNAQKIKILAVNRKRNGGVIKSDDPRWDPYVDLTAPNPAAWAIDHIVPKSANGDNSYGNARVISSYYNGLLSAKKRADILRTHATLKGMKLGLPRQFPAQRWKGSRIP